MPKIVVVKKEDVFPGRKVRAGIEPASCVKGNGSIPSMPPPEDVTQNQVMRTIMVPSTTKQFNDLLRSMLIVCSAHTRRLGYRSAPQKEMNLNIMVFANFATIPFSDIFLRLNSDKIPIFFR